MNISFFIEPNFTHHTFKIFIMPIVFICLFFYTFNQYIFTTGFTDVVSSCFPHADKPTIITETKMAKIFFIFYSTTLGTIK